MSNSNFDWARKRVLVTGGTGMLGIAVIKMLQDRNSKVFVVTRDESVLLPACTAISGDIVDAEEITAKLRTIELDVILHLAAQSQVNDSRPRMTFDANVIGTLNLLDVAARFHSSAAIVIASTCAVAPQWLELGSQSAAKAIFQPYVVSKMCAELIARSYFDSCGLSVGIARISNLYGPFDRNLRRLVPSTICAALNERAPVIRSDPRTPMNFLYVEDAASAILLFASKVAGDQSTCCTAAVSSEYSITIAAMVEAILTQMNRLDLLPDFSTHEPPIDYQNHEPPADPCGGGVWKPKISLDEGLRRTIGWYQSECTR